MAELELSISYRLPSAQLGFVIMCCLLPIWALLVPCCLGLFIALILKQPSIAPSITTMILLILTATPLLGLALTAFFEDDRLRVSKHGISFPLFMLWLLGFRLSRSWAELSQIGFSRAIINPSQPGKLLLRFNNERPVALSTAYLKKPDLEQLLLACELWGSNCARSEELVDYQSQLHNESAGISAASYTQMWEEELRRRFSATTFVPLEPEHKLMSGQLKIIRQIAFGGLSAIYLAQKGNRELVVLKEAVVPGNANIETCSKAKEHFRREANFLIQLDHPQIAKVYDNFTEHNRNYLLLEYINGQDLRQLVKQNGPQAESVVLRWAIQITNILHFLHSQDPPIVHRDLTPDNLVLQNNDVLKLIDFGAANQFLGTATGTLVGKQAYMAPEQLRGKAEPASDLYSLGGTLFFLLTAQDPLPLSVSHPQTIVPSISKATDELVASLTAFEHTARLSNSLVLLDKLNHLANQFPAVTVPS